MDEIYNSLLYTSAARSDRQNAADLILAHPERFKILLSHCFSNDKHISHRACWVLEFVCHRHLEWLLPELNTFLKNIPNLKNESSIRPIGKIFELLAEKYCEGTPEFVDNMTAEHLRQIVEQSFDWLIGKHKVATKAYSMQTLYYLRDFEPWVSPQLKHILQEQRNDHTAAYQARSKNLLKKLNKAQ